MISISDPYIEFISPSLVVQALLILMGDQHLFIITGYDSFHVFPYKYFTVLLCCIHDYLLQFQNVNTFSVIRYLISFLVCTEGLLEYVMLSFFPLFNLAAYSLKFSGIFLAYIPSLREKVSLLVHPEERERRMRGS